MRVFGPQVYELGRWLAQKQIHVKYGGAQCGLMGSLADGVIAEQGVIHGVITEDLAQYSHEGREIIHNGLSSQTIVATLADRKQELLKSDCVIVLPGGLGTFDEFFEIVTQNQLGLKHIPVILYSIQNFFDPLVAVFKMMLQHGFLTDAELHALSIAVTPCDLVGCLATHNMLG